MIRDIIWAFIYFKWWLSRLFYRQPRWVDLKYLPPFHFNCRSVIVPIMEDELVEFPPKQFDSVKNSKNVIYINRGKYFPEGYE